MATKRYGDKTAVDRLSFVVEPGVVTGFPGPNGAGKSTTMRMIAGLDRPTSGTVRVNGKHYARAPAPMAELGILLDARSVHPGLSARNPRCWASRRPWCWTSRSTAWTRMVCSGSGRCSSRWPPKGGRFSFRPI